MSKLYYSVDGGVTTDPSCGAPIYESLLDETWIEHWYVIVDDASILVLNFAYSTAQKKLVGADNIRQKYFAEYGVVPYRLTSISMPTEVYKKLMEEYGINEDSC